MSDTGPEAEVRELIRGYFKSRCIHAAVQLGVPDILADTALSSAEVATRADADRDGMDRLLRALSSIGIVAQSPDHLFSLTPRGALLRSESGSSLRSEALHLLHDASWATWGRLTDSIKTGQAAFPTVFGTSAWAYREANEEAGRRFADMASRLSAHSAPLLACALDLSRAKCVVDLGGGEGHLLIALLKRWPGLRGLLVEQRSVQQAASRAFSDAGVSDRCAWVEGDLLNEVPRDGDVYLLKSVLHDWDDGNAARILRNCRQAMSPGAELIVIEALRRRDDDAAQAFMDLHMLVTHGGRERRPEELESLMTTAGFRLIGTEKAGSHLHIARGSPA